MCRDGRSNQLPSCSCPGPLCASKGLLLELWTGAATAAGHACPSWWSLVVPFHILKDTFHHHCRMPRHPPCNPRPASLQSGTRTSPASPARAGNCQVCYVPAMSISASTGQHSSWHLTASALCPASAVKTGGCEIGVVIGNVQCLPYAAILRQGTAFRLGNRTCCMMVQPLYPKRELAQNILLPTGLHLLFGTVHSSPCYAI